MRPVNLLPEKERPYVPSGQRQGVAYVVVGLLVVLLLGTGAYVLMVNSLTSTREKTEQVRQEADAAEAKAGRLSAFGAFSQVKTTRYASVTELARGRFDWERLMREMARVLPPSVYVTSMSAGTNGEGSTPAGQSGGSAPPSDSSAGEGAPQLTLSGCATSQPEVATTLVRLRSLHRAVDVRLADSSKETVTPGGGPAASSGSTGTSAPAASGGGGTAAGANDGCEARGGRPDYRFQATVVFGQDPDAGPGRVPGSLGGGS
jgi:Tfp pilus assembly protein PilN